MDQLRELILATIEALNEKLQESPEPVVRSYLGKYEAVIQMMNDGEILEIGDTRLNKIRNLARGYLETSSLWDQPFLHSMGETEDYLKAAEHHDL